MRNTVTIILISICFNPVSQLWAEAVVSSPYASFVRLFEPQNDTVSYYRERQYERNQMVDLLTKYIGVRITDANVLEAMRKLPRHRFMPAKVQSLAYSDSPASIGYGQTISQPYIVALMSQLIRTKKGLKVLEIGTGSGYQAAVLSAMGAEVYTIEIIAPLAKRAHKTFQQLGLTKIKTREGDGYYGWPQDFQFDRIIVTAAAAHIPPPLLKQLKPGGLMVIPVGPRWGTQELLLVTKDDAGNSRTRSIIPVRFVPLTGDKGE